METLFIELKSWIPLIGILVGLALAFCKPWWDQQYELFTKAVEPKAADKALLAAIKQGDRTEFAELSADEQTRLIRSVAMATYLRTIKAKDWSVKYRAMLARLLAMLARLFNEPSPAAKPTNGLERWFCAQVFTSHSYGFCLKLALFYPIGFSMVSWLVAGELTVGGRVLLAAMPVADRLGLLLAMMLLVWGLTIIVNGVATGKAMGNRRQLAVATVNIVIGLFLLKGYSSSAVAVTVTVAAVGFILYLIYKWQPSPGQSFFKFWLKINGLLIGYTVAALLIVIGLAQPDRQFLVLLPVFFCVLPLLNAFVDWCSVNITRGLLWVMRDNHHKGWQSMGFAAVDLLLVVGFVFVITTIMVTVLAGINSLSIKVNGQGVLNFSEIMAQLINPSQYFWQTFWVHAMVLFTLIPILLHLGYAIIAVVLWPKFGWPQKNAAAFYDSAQAKTKLFYYAMFSRLISGLIFIVVCVGLYHGLSAVIEPIAQGLWLWADLLLGWFDSGYGK